MYGYIYLTTNIINGKKYIGKHKASIFEPDVYKGSGKILLRAFKKYGKENFRCELLEWCETKEQLNNQEKYWISKFNCQNSTNYYNISKGGDGGIGRDISNPNSYWNNPKKREAAIKKESETLKEYHKNHPGKYAGENNPNYGKKTSIETKKKISNALKKSIGCKNSRRFAGKHHTEETKQKLSLWGKNKRWINNGTKSAYILVNEELPTGWVFGKLASDETNKRIEKFKNIIINSDTGKKKKVYCIELDLIFESAAAASKKLGINNTHISSCCHGKRNTAGGYHWEFIIEE